MFMADLTCGGSNKAAPIRPTLSHGLDTLCKIETLIATFALNDAYRQRRRFQGRNILADALSKSGDHVSAVPGRHCREALRFSNASESKLAIPGQGEVNLPGQLRSIGAAYEQPIGGLGNSRSF